MEDVYNDLENYDDVDLVNQLRTENAELKQKLGEYNSSMKQLQKDFDKLSAEFKTLEKNYSSLLLIARAEVKRKTDMIANLNIEKDMLVIKAMQSGSRNVQNLVRDVHAEALKPKKKKRIKATGPKDREAFIRKDCERPPSSEGLRSRSSSTGNDNNNHMLKKERVMDNMTSSNRYSGNSTQKDVHNTDHRGDGIRSPIPDRRVSTLARQRFTKLSSDEEFEDMYSALEPKSTSYRAPDRSRKRGRDDPQEGRPYYNALGPHDKTTNFPDPFREGFNKRANRFSDADRNTKRDKSYNESERNRDKHDSHYRKYSPDRRRRSGRDLSGDRYPQQQDRHRRLESPPRQRYQHWSRDRRPYRSRDREEDQQNIHTYNYPDTHRHKMHDEYDEPQNKRPRIEYPTHQEERRHIEKENSKEIISRDTIDHTCQSPDFSHTENESCNESVREIKSTASTIIEDPRLNSSKYIKKIEGDKDVLCTVNVNEMYLQPINRTLWDANGPKVLTSKPLEISEEHVELMEAEKPLSIMSMESGELGSEATDIYLDDFIDYSDERAVSSHKDVYNERDTRRMDRVNDEEKTPTGNTSKDDACKSDVVRKDFKPVKHKSGKSDKASKRCRTPEPSERTPDDGNNVGKLTRRDSFDKPSILHKLIESVRDIPDSPERLNTVKLSNDTEEKKLKRIPKLRISYKPKPELSKSTEEKEHISLPELSTSDKSDTEKSKNTERKQLKRLGGKKKSDMLGKETTRSSGGKDLKSVTELKASDCSEKETPKSIEGLKVQSSCELKASDKTENEKSKNSEVKETSGKTENETVKNTQERDKKLAVLKKIKKSEKETSKNAEEHKSSSSFIKDNSNKETENNVSIFREFEHRVYATRNIVEGDLELSDESNDDSQAPFKIVEKVEVKKKQNSKRNRDTSKDKQVDLEDTTRRTRSKKEKEKVSDTKNKFSELFGDSSSLITPEELGLATKETLALPADCCPPLYEDALDGITDTLKLQTQPDREPDNISKSKDARIVSTTEKDKEQPKTRDSKTRKNHKKHKDTESTLVPSDTRTISNDLPLIGATEQTDDSSRSGLATEVQLSLSNEMLKEILQMAKKTSDVNKDGMLKHTENSKEPVKNNMKRKDERRLSSSESTEESKMKKSYDPKPTEPTNLNEFLVMGDNKENASCNDKSERNVSGEMARMFEDTLVPSKITSVVSSKVGDEKLLTMEKAKEPSAGFQDGLNLAPVIDDPGLVKTVVISTGVQPDSNIVQYPPMNVLATSTPAKEPTINTSSEMDSKIHHTTVNVTIAHEDSVPQPETDAPDMRITYYKRRRKVLKR